MKKRISYILLAVVLAVQLSACGADEEEASGIPDEAQDAEVSGGMDTGGEQGAGLSGGQEISISSGGILDPSAISGLAGKDNSLDSFSAAARVSLQTEKPENAIEGGATGSCLAATGAYHFKKHLFQTLSEDWDELIFVTVEGKAGSQRIPRENQLLGIGPAAGTDHYVTLGEEAQEDGEGDRCFLTEWDENHEKLREFPLDFMGGDFSEVWGSLLGFAVDKSGAAHLIRYSEEGMLQYLLVSQEGGDPGGVHA